MHLLSFKKFAITFWATQYIIYYIYIYILYKLKKNL